MRQKRATISGKCRQTTSNALHKIVPAVVAQVRQAFFCKVWDDICIV